MKRGCSWSLIVIVLTIAGLALAGCLLFALLRARYESRLRQQIWPANAVPVPVQAGPVTGKSPTVLLMGDSRITEWNLPRLGNCRVVNAGMAGYTTGQIRLCTGEILDTYHPEVVVLQAGINDLKYLGLRPDLTSTIVSLASSNITAIVAECVKRHSRILVLETWPAGAPSPMRRLVWSEQVGPGVDGLNAELRKMDSRDDGIRVVDLFQRAGLKPGPDQYRDTLHFKPEVYGQLTPVLEKEVGALLP